MALFRDDEGKTEQPTAGKLSQASNKGHVPLSREFTMAGTLLIAVFTLKLAGSWLVGTLRDTVAHGLDVDLREHLLGDDPGHGATLEIGRLFATIAPPFVFLLAVFLIATALFGYGQIGFKFRREALRLQPERLNPASNLGRLFRLSSVVRTGVSALKLAVLGAVLYFVLRAEMPTFARLYENEDLALSIAAILDAVFTVLIWIAVIVLVISIGDLAYQRYDYIQNLKMTKQEVEDERKRTDGDPFVKSRLKSARLELMRQRMMQAIPTADVVITNPTHWSVAMRYERGVDPAPRVVAKGVDELAFRIRELAAEHGVPLMEDPPLARALFRAVKVDQPIPERFYKAVAAVLSHVYRMRGEVA